MKSFDFSHLTVDNVRDWFYHVDETTMLAIRERLQAEINRARDNRDLVARVIKTLGDAVELGLKIAVA